MSVIEVLFVAGLDLVAVHDDLLDVPGQPLSRNVKAEQRRIRFLHVNVTQYLNRIFAIRKVVEGELLIGKNAKSFSSKCKLIKYFNNVILSKSF